MTEHNHDHEAIEGSECAPGYYELLEITVRELLIEKQLITAAEIRRQLEVLDSRTPAMGARIVDVAVRVGDSTAMMRFMVLPLRPEGTENFSEEELAALVTRDTMIGVVHPSLNARNPQ
jgi:hypothetical protein